MERITSNDFFILTAILTIATRDQPKYSMLHRHCWEHTQRLLLDVLLSHPWTQTPTTVQGLLLLSEWLPHIQMRHSTSAESGNSFSEDRTAWSIIGQAVRHAYMLRLDRAAFRDKSSMESTEETDTKRLIWACKCHKHTQLSNLLITSLRYLFRGSTDLRSARAVVLVARSLDSLPPDRKGFLDTSTQESR